MGNYCIGYYYLKNKDNNKFNELSLKGKSVWGKVLSIYDGDTLTIGIRVWGQNFSCKIRMLGYDSPEMKPRLNIKNRDEEIRKAHEAKDFLDNLIGDDRMVWVEFKEFDKYGRALGNLYNSDPNGCTGNQISFNQQMINAGHGYPYEGGTKKKQEIVGEDNNTRL